MSWKWSPQTFNFRKTFNNPFNLFLESVSYIFHPSEPFAMSLGRSEHELVLNFHFCDNWSLNLSFIFLHSKTALSWKIKKKLTLLPLRDFDGIPEFRHLCFSLLMSEIENIGYESVYFCVGRIEKSWLCYLFANYSH